MKTRAAYQHTTFHTAYPTGVLTPYIQVENLTCYHYISGTWPSHFSYESTRIRLVLYSVFHLARLRGIEPLSPARQAGVVDHYTIDTWGDIRVLIPRLLPHKQM